MYSLIYHQNVLNLTFISLKLLFKKIMKCAFENAQEQGR